ncbi:quinol:cytochrome C oxidoreductase [Lewinellaceae bacterium SD302]|nr:quinol:cytochrome C oxidoreductase [Lewinellaceae bacterium SD302]
MAHSIADEYNLKTGEPVADGHHHDVLFALYDDEEKLMAAVKEANSRHLHIMEVYTPFPVHGLDPLLGFEESRLHQAGFVYGALGTLTAFGFMTWVFTRDWPIIFGGKPYWSVPAFIPITFELTVLFAAVGMVVTFYIICGLGPGAEPIRLHDRITDDKFCIAFDLNHGGDDEDSIRDFFSATGAESVHRKLV